MSSPQASTYDRHRQKKRPNKQNLLLQGLEVLEQFYALGLDNGHFFRELETMETEARTHARRLGQTKENQQALQDLIRDLKLVDDIIRKHRRKKNALIQILLEVQKRLNWLPRHTLKWISARLDIPLAQIDGVAHFYEALSLKPRGAHQVQICMGTACHVRGAPGLLAKVSGILGIRPGQTDPQQKFTLETVHCLGCCALGPVMAVDNEYYSDPSTEQIEKIAAL